MAQTDRMVPSTLPMWVTVGHLREPYNSERDRQQDLQAMADDLERQAGDRLGASAERFLFGFLPGVVSDKPGNTAYYDNEFHQEILGAFGYRYRLVGASAADHLDPTIGYQFANNEFLTSGLALALIQSDIGTGAMLTHGFEPCSDTRVSVDELAGGGSSGYEVSVLDGKPASERLRELKSAGLTKLGNPVFGLPCGPDFNIIWPLAAADEQEVSVRLKRRVARGDNLYVLGGAPSQLLKAGGFALKTALERSSYGIDDLSLILGFSCVGRLNYYDAHNSNIREVLDQLRKDYAGIPLVGALSAGEFGVDQWRRTRANNMSISVVCMTNRYSRRARTRTLQSKLLSAAGCLSTHDAPVKVMEAALKGAVDAGATGGKISLVDHKLGRILGREVGYAFQPPLSPQNWSAVARYTDRSVAKRGGIFPLRLRDLAMPVVSNLPFELDFRDDGRDKSEVKEDILTLTVRTLHAVFIPAARTQPYCDQEAREAGNIICFLAIPLVGSQLRVIATLQVSFPDETRIDREAFSFWIGYAQKIASALERSQEVEERNINGKLHRLSNSIIQRPIGPDSSRLLSWCREYLLAVVRALEADGAHMRVLRPGTRGDEFHLVDAVGWLSELLPLTRRVVREGDGSYDRGRLEKGGQVSNTHEETTAYNSTVKAVENGELFGEALGIKLGKLEGTALASSLWPGSDSRVIRYLQQDAALLYREA